MSNPLKRLLAATVGAGLAISSLFFSYRVMQGIYYDYISFPRLKAEDHYVAPTRWQDFTFQTVFWTFSLLALLAAFRLIRFALGLARQS